MKRDLDFADPGAGTPDAALEPHAPPGALIHGMLAAAASVADAATRALAAHRLTLDEHALLSRLAAGARHCDGTPGVALLSMVERGFVRHRAGTSRRGGGVELTGSGARLLADAGVVLQQLETRMPADLASRYLPPLHRDHDDIGAVASARSAVFT